ncbi:hypothetical protein [Enterobacter hormaechei]|uniref:hypothetical protein n=1 Tax=Enterobacter hormaechei TaxID=158836 RepID=UPI00388EA1FD
MLQVTHRGRRKTSVLHFDTLMNQGIATRALSERVKVADELGIDLRGSDEGVDLLLNGRDVDRRSRLQILNCAL